MRGMLLMGMVFNWSWRRCGAIAIAVVMAIALSGCSTAQLVTPTAQVPRLVLSDLSDPKTFNPILSEESNSAFGFIFESLIAENGETGELEPALAESWEISEDQQSIIFTLREGLKWSDGEPFTIDDIFFTYNQIYFNDAIPSSEKDILRVGASGAFPTVSQAGDRQVEFRSPEPFAPLLRFVGGLPILPKHVLEESVLTTDSEGQPRFLSSWTTETPPEQIVSNGPFRLASYQPGERTILQRNPHYWRTSNGTPQPYIDRVVLEIVESTDNSLMQFRSGGLDLVSIQPDYFSLVKQEEERGNFTIYEGGPTLSTTFITFNLNKGSRNGKPLIDPIKSRWFNSLEFRRAIAHAIDRSTMINNIYQGLGVPQNSPISIQSPYYFPPEKGLLVYEYDVEQAKQLLSSAGFQYNDAKQLLDADGNRVRFTLITNAGNKIREAMGAQVKQDLAAIGIQVDFQPVSFNTLVSKLSDSLDWEAHILGFSGAGVEPSGGINVWAPEGRLHAFNQSPDPSQDPLEGREVTDWEAKIGQLYIQGSQELDETKRKAIYAETQRLAQEYVPFIHLVNPLSLVAVRDRVQGVKYSALGGALWNVYELRVEP